jgi:ubiquinone/menaquinone biosynthesis C-methylase UbiE
MTLNASLESAMSPRLHRPTPSDQMAHTDWSAYSTAYDLLSLHNPAYRDLLRDFDSFLSTIDPPRVIYDIGGGTGNYSEVAARTFPDSDIYLAEPDAGMIQAARSKLSQYRRVRFHAAALQDFKAPGEADLIICVHALYTMPNQRERLAELRQLLRTGGHLYLIDLGRYMDVADWRRYLFAMLRREHGLISALKIFWQGRQVAKQNKAILKSQQSGAYWTFSGNELAAAVSNASFEILKQKAVYRGYSDLLVCRARP